MTGRGFELQRKTAVKLVFEIYFASCVNISQKNRHVTKFFIWRYTTHVDGWNHRNLRSMSAKNVQRLQSMFRFLSSVVQLVRCLLHNAPNFLAHIVNVKIIVKISGQTSHKPNLKNCIYRSLNSQIPIVKTVGTTVQSEFNNNTRSLPKLLFQTLSVPTT